LILKQQNVNVSTMYLLTDEDDDKIKIIHSLSMRINEN